MCWCFVCTSASIGQKSEDQTALNCTALNHITLKIYHVTLLHSSLMRWEGYRKNTSPFNPLPTGCLDHLVYWRKKIYDLVAPKPCYIIITIRNLVIIFDVWYLFTRVNINCTCFRIENSYEFTYDEELKDV